MPDQKLQSTVETSRRATLGNVGAGRAQIVVTWALALLTVPAAIIVVFIAIGSVMSTAGCSGDACSAPTSFLFGILFYGAPVVAAVAILVSFFTVKRRWGIAVPLVALALQALDVALLFATFR